jgi:hypothetical protein
MIIYADRHLNRASNSLALISDNPSIEALKVMEKTIHEFRIIGANGQIVGAAP